MSQKIEQTIGYPFLKHLTNTAAIHRHKELQFDMVRLGIGLYGIDPNLKLENVYYIKDNHFTDQNSQQRG